MPGVPPCTLSDSLLLLLAEAERGPRRDGLYALWLTARAATDLGAAIGIETRPRNRRLDALEHRLSSLTLSAPLRRGLTAAVGHLRESTAQTPTLALSQLIAPVRDSLGVPASQCLAEAAREARRTLAEAR